MVRPFFFCAKIKKTIMKIITQNIISLWIFWYFFEMPQNILKAWKNFLLFNLNYFSIPLLLRTLFSHWRRYSWKRGRGFNVGEYFNVLFSNLMSRFMGAIVRSILILIGLIFEVFIILFGIVIFLGWFILPILLISGALIGFLLLI